MTKKKRPSIDTKDNKPYRRISGDPKQFVDGGLATKEQVKEVRDELKAACKNG